MSIVLDGTGSITGLTSGAGIAAAALSGQVPDANAPSGSVIQVVQTVKTDSFVTSATVTDTAVTGLTASITPTSASSKILVLVALAINAENAQGGAPKITRNGTAIGLADAAGSRSRSSFSGSGYRGNAGGYTIMGWGVSANLLDSPATTSAVTYGVTVSSITDGTWVNRTQDDSDIADRMRSVSSITLMEIAA